MNQLDPMTTLPAIFKSDRFTVLAPKKTRRFLVWHERPSVQIRPVIGNRFEVVFSLKRIVAGQTFLGLYPTASNLPDADKLRIGDYALLGSGEIIQIGK
jgi:hypothetical protein